jgi:hypothetical protein
MLNEHHITVTKTARYYSQGVLNATTERIWIVVHGYLQRAEDFIKMFDFLDDGKTYIVAPEALNRSYLKGGYDKTGATWMTKDDRENEIKDYVNLSQSSVSKNSSRKTGTRHHECIGVLTRRYNSFALVEQQRVRHKRTGFICR